MVRNDRNDDSSYKNKLSNMSDLTFNSSDAFNNIIASDTVHRIDVPSTYNFSSERLIYFENGTRTDFGNSSKTVDDPAKWILNASAGDVLSIETRARIRYAPGYENEYGISWHIEGDLPDGAKVIIEQGDGTNGFRAVYTNKGAEYQLIRDSTVQDTFTFEKPVPVTQPQIDKGRNNMYGVGNSKLYKYFLDAEKRDVFEQVARVGDNTHLSVDNFNLPMKVTIDCSGSTSGAEFHVGSFEAKTRGNGTPITREKKNVEFDLGGSIDDTSWTPILAMRKQPGYENVTVDITKFKVFPTDRMKFVLVGVDPENTDATDFTTSSETTAENDAVQYTRTVTTPTTPQGRQMSGVLADGGKKGEGIDSAETTITPLYDDDVLVMLARTKKATGSSVDAEVTTSQEW